MTRLVDVAKAALHEAGWDCVLNNKEGRPGLSPNGTPPPETVWKATQIARRAGGVPIETYDEWLDRGRQAIELGHGDAENWRYWLSIWGLLEGDQ